MDQSQISVWFPLVAIAWIVFVIAASVVFRRKKGKPVFPTIPIGAIYAEKWASGRWANNCLLVAVTDDSLLVVPKFPFNLMFLAEIYGLERTIPLRSIREVRRLKGFGLGNNVVVDYGDAELRLRVRDREAFVEAITSSRKSVTR